MSEREQHGADGPTTPSLPAIRAFVVQFGGETRNEGGVCGRVEHLASGHATHFDSWARLREFVERYLEASLADAPDERAR